MSEVYDQCSDEVGEVILCGILHLRFVGIGSMRSAGAENNCGQIKGHTELLSPTNREAKYLAGTGGDRRTRV